MRIHRERGKEKLARKNKTDLVDALAYYFVSGDMRSRKSSLVDSAHYFGANQIVNVGHQQSHWLMSGGAEVSPL